MKVEKMMIEEVFPMVYPPGAYCTEAIITVTTNVREFLMYVQKPENNDWQLVGFYVNSIENVNNEVQLEEGMEWFHIYMNSNKDTLNLLADAVDADFMNLMEQEELE